MRKIEGKTFILGARQKNVEHRRSRDVQSLSLKLLRKTHPRKFVFINSTSLIVSSSSCLAFSREKNAVIKLIEFSYPLNRIKPERRWKI